MRTMWCGPIKGPHPTRLAHQPIELCNSITRHIAKATTASFFAFSLHTSSSAMASRSALIALLVVVSCAAAASATQYTVGDSQGWGFSVDYSTWASGKPFKVGDKLVFDFTTGQHDVVEVPKSSYDGCSTSNSLSTTTNGPATITLNTTGTHYYICGFSGHCGQGMKLAVTVGSGSSAGAPSSQPTPPAGSPSTPTTPGSPSSPTAPASPSSASVRLAAAPALAVAAGVLVKLALF